MNALYGLNYHILCFCFVFSRASWCKGKGKG